MKLQLWIDRCAQPLTPANALATALICAGLLIATRSSDASTIGVNFYANHVNGSSQVAAETVGAPGYVQTNWNDVTTSNFSSGSNVSASGIALHDSTGAASPVTFAFTSDGNWAWSFNDVSTPETRLMSGYALVKGNDDHHYVQFDNVPDGSYQVVLYTAGPFVNESTYTVTDGAGTTVTTSQPMKDTEWAANGFITNPNNVAALSSYMVMDAAPDANHSIRLSLATTYFDAWSAVQLVSAVPEPGSLVLLALGGGMGLMLCRRSGGA